MSKRNPKLLIFLTVFIDLLGFGIIIPILPKIARETAGGDAALAGILLAAFSTCQMLFSPFWGRLSDRIGRRPVVLVSLFGSVVAYTMFGLVRSYEMLLLSRIIAGICGANLAAAQAYLADVSKPEERTAAMGFIGMAFGLGFALGPVIGGGSAWLGEQWRPELASQTFPGLVAAAICLINLVWAWFSLPESLPAEKRGQVVPGSRRFAGPREVLATLGHPVVGPMILLFFLITFAFANLEMAFVLYAANDTIGLGLETIGIYGVFIYIGFVMTIVHGYVVRKAVKFVPESILVIFGSAVQVVGLAILPLYPALGVLLLGMGVVSIGQGLSTPPLLALISKATSAEDQGRVMGVTQSASSFARIIGPVFAGFLIKFSDERWPFWAGAAVMAFSVWMAVQTRRRVIDTPLPKAETSPRPADTV